MADNPLTEEAMRRDCATIANRYFTKLKAVEAKLAAAQTALEIERKAREEEEEMPTWQEFATYWKERAEAAESRAISADARRVVEDSERWQEAKRRAWSYSIDGEYLVTTRSAGPHSDDGAYSTAAQQFETDINSAIAAGKEAGRTPDPYCGFPDFDSWQEHNEAALDAAKETP